jgi:hypothetical protein
VSCAQVVSSHIMMSCTHVCTSRAHSVLSRTPLHLLHSRHMHTCCAVLHATDCVSHVHACCLVHMMSCTHAVSPTCVCDALRTPMLSCMSSHARMPGQSCTPACAALHTCLSDPAHMPACLCCPAHMPVLSCTHTELSSDPVLSCTHACAVCTHACAVVDIPCDV